MAIYVFGDKPQNAAELTAFAHSMGAECVAFVCGKDAQAYANIGAEKVLYLGNAMPESYAKAVSAVLKEQHAELFAASVNTAGRELAAKVAGYCDCPIICDITAMEKTTDGFKTERMLYGGAVIRRETVNAFAVVTVPAGKYQPEEGACQVDMADCSADGRVSVVSSAPIIREGVDITSADKVVGVGMGFTNREELELAYDLAKTLGAELGCTRSLAEDKHWFSEYIGLSGIQICPRLYVALGISGQIQHSVGVRGSQIIVAINKDEKCPMFTGCDYGIVGDIHELVPLLTEALKAL